jgi:peptidyl-dipeptidase Dcp
MTAGTAALLEPSALPYGLPDFAAFTDADVEPAARAAMDDHNAEIAAIIANPERPTVDNTSVALELSGQALNRVLSTFYNLVGPDATVERQDIDRRLSPLLAQHFAAIWLDTELFARVRAVAERIDAGSVEVDDETRRLVEKQMRDFTRRGAAADDSARGRIAEIDERLAELTTAFGENVLRSTADLAVHVTDETELAGLDEATVSSLAANAKEAGRNGWLIPLGLPTVQPLSAQLTNAGLRARLMAASLQRGRTVGADNTPLVLEIATLRAERAELLGYACHADYVLEEETAKTAEAARGLLEGVADAAITNARHEAKDMLGGDEDAPLSPADWAHFAERLRAERFSVEDAAVRPYFELDTVLRDGVMYAGSTLYGLEFTRRVDLAGYLPDVQVWEVRRPADDDPETGLILLDYYARPTKRGGAWMSAFTDQSTALGTKPVVVNVMNIAKPAADAPTLLTRDEVTTMFHEFGHALHGLLSQVRYPTFSGTNVPRDFVEFPSQVNEMWADESEVLSRFAHHVDSGSPIPQDLVTRLREAEKFGQGQATVEYLGAALIDLAWHSLSLEQARATDDVDAFESQVLASAGLDVEGIEPRYRSRYFQHIFAGGYSAAYYSYFWAEVLDADAADWFRSGGGLRAELGERLRTAVLSRGGAIDFDEAYRAFRGADPDPAPLLRRRGLESSVVR